MIVAQNVCRATLDHTAQEETHLLSHATLELRLASRRLLLCRNASLAQKASFLDEVLRTALLVPMERLLRPQGRRDASRVHQGVSFRKNV